MVNTIGNPVSWAARNLGATGEHVSKSVSQLGGEDVKKMHEINKLTQDDLRAALQAGYQDFLETRADAIFVVLVYPLVGLVLFGLGLQMNLIPLLAPLVAGFAILGPVAAVGLYEISRRREAGLEAHWLDALGVFRSPAFGAILALGFYLTMLFLIWLMSAQSIYAQTLGPEAPASVSAFIRDVFLTAPGWTMILLGSLVGFLFAVIALAMSVVSFPLLLDRHVGVPIAVVTSVKVLRRNPTVILTWGALVLTMLVIGSIPLLLGLIFVMPILGHATWHLYRRAIS